MSTRRASWLAWSLAAAGLAMLAAGGALLAINLDMVGFNASAIVLFGSCAVIGALAVSRQPGNLVGWLFLATGVVAAMQLFTGELALFLYRHGGPLLAVQWLAWPANWVWNLSFGSLFTLLPLLFPDGRLPSWRWHTPSRPDPWTARGLRTLPGSGSASAVRSPVCSPAWPSSPWLLAFCVSVLFSSGTTMPMALYASRSSGSASAPPSR